MFKRITISWKLGFLVGLSTLALVVSIAIAASFLHQRMMDDRIGKLRALVESAQGMAAGLEEVVKAGKMTREDAFAALRTNIHAMWYDDHRNYLIAFTMEGISIANAADPKQVGTSRLAATDVNGKPIVGSFIAALRDADEAIVTYHFPKPGQTDPLPKTTLIRTFKPWNILIGTGVYTDDIEAEFRTVLAKLGGAALAILLLTVAAAYLVGRNITRPLGSLKGKMEKLVAGELDLEFGETQRGDEIGAMAKTVQVFRDNAASLKTMQAEQENLKAKADAEKKQAMQTLARDFEAAVGTIVTGIASTARELENSAHTMTSTVEDAARQSTAVSAAAEEASTNVQTVASAAEELTASITEISRQVSDSASIAGQAASDAERTNVQVKALADAAQKIGDVVKLINNIAGQTNLLALNATIEAARAGEAGKGFAVVASEVKSLANQTAKATEDIAAQVKSIQTATSGSVQAIQEIGQTIGRINQIATTIASAVEEQGAATKEIARNVQQASAGTQDVSSNITGVARAVGEAGSAAGIVKGATGNLSRESDALRTQVERFLAGIRAA
ncbi:MAG: cache domain-containing protein [Proteobacteria bacterium]|nr:cache domain-containing protein [Pseudomonadota bacterium]